VIKYKTKAKTQEKRKQQRAEKNGKQKRNNKSGNGCFCQVKKTAGIIVEKDSTKLIKNK